MRGPHGLGKTCIGSVGVLWFALTRDGEDWKAATTAGTWHQLTHYLWPEIHKWSRFVRWDVLERNPLTRYELLNLHLKLGTGEAFSASPADSAAIEGAHADSVLYVFDEAKIIPATTFDAAEGAFSGAGEDTPREAMALAISTPGEPNGRFHEIHKRSPGTEDWWVRHVTLDEAIDAGRVSAEWAEQRRRQWGEGSAVYQNRVLGEFASADEDSTIPLAWVEQANTRWMDRCIPETLEQGREAVLDPVTLGPLTDLGIDVARGGQDATVFAERHDTTIGPLRRYPFDADTTVTAGRAEGILRSKPARAVVDAIGVGAGVFDQLRALEIPGAYVVAFVASEGTQRKDRSGELGFSNCLTGDARVVPVGRLLRLYRTRHEGPLLRIEMSSGREFTVTPNHNVLTLAGWQPVHALNVGDKLCDSGLGESTPGHAQVGDVPPQLREMYRAAEDHWGAERIGALRVDFHGDRPVGDVEVVTVHGDLSSMHPSFGQRSDQRALVGSLVSLRRGSVEGTFPPGVKIGGPRSRGVPSIEPLLHDTGTALATLGRRQPGVLDSFGRGASTNGDPGISQSKCDPGWADPVRAAHPLHGRPSDVFGDDGSSVELAGDERSGGGPVPWLDAAFGQDSPNNVPVDPVSLAKRMERLAGRVPTDQIIAIEVVAEHRDPFVYTLETTTGAYHGGIVHRNCRSAAWWSLREQLDPSYGSDLALPPDDFLTGDLTAPRWRLMAGGRIQVESKDDIRKRLGRSTDSGDSVVQAMWDEERDPARVEVPGGRIPKVLPGGQGGRRRIGTGGRR